MFDIAALVNAVVAALAVATFSTHCAAVFPMSLLLLLLKLLLVMVDCHFFFGLLVHLLLIPCCHPLPLFAVVGHALPSSTAICHCLPLFAIICCQYPHYSCLLLQMQLTLLHPNLLASLLCTLHFHQLIVDMFVIIIVDCWSIICFIHWTCMICSYRYYW